MRFSARSAALIRSPEQTWRECTSVEQLGQEDIASSPRRQRKKSEKTRNSTEPWSVFRKLYRSPGGSIKGHKNPGQKWVNGEIKYRHTYSMVDRARALAPFQLTKTILFVPGHRDLIKNSGLINFDIIGRVQRVRPRFLLPIHGSNRTTATDQGKVISSKFSLLHRDARISFRENCVDVAVVLRTAQC